ncbi:MAG: DCC1-like thiol-disulfide oxidoreductase family protein [Planctomycetaceae bacterium]
MDETEKSGEVTEPQLGEPDVDGPQMPQVSRDSAVEDRLPHDGPVLFYDGSCGLCDHSVTFVMHRDRRGLFRFAQLQGETAARYLPVRDVTLLKSIVLWDAGCAYRKSSAVVRILWWLGGCWRVCSWLLWLVPRPVRNVAYALVSRTRYFFFGRYETCRVPTGSERERLLP